MGFEMMTSMITYASIHFYDLHIYKSYSFLLLFYEAKSDYLADILWFIKRVHQIKFLQLYLQLREKRMVLTSLLECIREALIG